jgi:hypothetical protein
MSEFQAVYFVYSRVKTQSKFFTHFGAPRALAQLTQRTRARAAYLTKQARTFEAGQHSTMLAAAVCQSYRETIRDGAGNSFTPKTILKLNLLIVLYLKV